MKNCTYFFLLLIGVGLFYSCSNKKSQYTISLLRAEKMMEIDSIKAISLYQNISVPDDIITDKDFFRIHSHHCIANIYYYQTVNHLKNGKLNQAENCLLNNIKYNTLAYYEFFHHNSPYSIVKLETLKKEIKQYSAYLDTLITAKVNYSGKTNNSVVSHLLLSLTSSKNS